MCSAPCWDSGLVTVSRLIPGRSIMDIAEECLETPIEDFKLTITDIVDNIEVS
jgi:hypothetical protein